METILNFFAMIRRLTACGHRFADNIDGISGEIEARGCGAVQVTVGGNGSRLAAPAKAPEVEALANAPAEAAPVPTPAKVAAKRKAGG